MLTIDKKKIQTSFNKAYKTYDKFSYVQNIICKMAVHKLISYKQTYDCIIDMACGTGESTRVLLSKVNNKICYAVDISEMLLLVAKNKIYPSNDVKFIHCDFNGFNCDQSMDLVFCNMGLQWSNHKQKSLTKWGKIMSEDGLLVFTLPLDNNFPEINNQYKILFDNHTEIINVLDKAGFNCVDSTVESITVDFESQMEILRYLKSTGVNMANASQVKGLSRLNIDNIFKNTKSKLTYRFGIYIARLKK